MKEDPFITITRLDDLPKAKDAAGIDYFEIFWLQDAAAPKFVKEHSIEETGDWMVLVSPFRSYKPETRNLQGLYLSFRKDLLEYEFKEYSLDVYKLFSSQTAFSMLFLEDEEDRETLLGLAEILFKESRRRGTNFLFLKNLLKTFLLKLVNLKTRKFTVPNLNEKRVYQFLLLVDTYYLTERRTDFYAEKLHLSPKRLNQILKKKLNKTISQIIQERVIMEAKHQLYLGEKNIMEVGIHLGFSDKSYFSRFFKKMTGLTPEGYKRGVKKLIKLKS